MFVVVDCVLCLFST